MSLPSIMALVEPRHGAATLKLAGLAGAALGAPVSALVVKRDPRDAIPMVGEGLSGDLVQQIMDSAEADANAAANAARALIDSATGLQNATLIEKVGRTEDVIGRMGRAHGLNVLSCGMDGDGAVTIDAALFQTGRPALIAPLHEVASVGKRAAIFWNDSAEAAKAVWGSIPFLRQADVVKVFSSGDADDVSEPLDRIGEGLARAGVNAETVRLSPDGGDAVSLTDAAADMDADLVVMGAFTHSRLRELVLGGVTQSTLDGLARPTLLAH